MELSDEFGGIITYDDRLATRFSSSCWTPAPITDAHREFVGRLGRSTLVAFPDQLRPTDCGHQKYERVGGSSVARDPDLHEGRDEPVVRDRHVAERQDEHGAALHLAQQAESADDGGLHGEGHHEDDVHSEPHQPER